MDKLTHYPLRKWQSRIFAALTSGIKEDWTSAQQIYLHLRTEQSEAVRACVYLMKRPTPKTLHCSRKYHKRTNKHLKRSTRNISVSCIRLCCALFAMRMKLRNYCRMSLCRYGRKRICS